MKKIYFAIVIAIILVSNSLSQPGLEPDTIFVSSGWNLIGSKFTGAVSDIVLTEPPGILASPFYRFTSVNGYLAADTLEESSGYWIKVSDLESAGMIIIRPFRPFFVCGAAFLGRLWYSERYYNSVQIGSQCWLKQNIDVGEFKFATIIGSQTNNLVIEKYCYSDDSSNCDAYGGLYQWGEAMQYETTEGSRGICPIGWHIPTLQEILILKANVSDDGNALKAIGQGTGAGAGTNTSKFSALLVGYKGYTNEFYHLNEGTHYWSSTLSSSLPNFMVLEGDNDIIALSTVGPSVGFSVRCIKNE